jgi:hypothetical protein
MSACGLGRVNVITSRGLSEFLETFCHYCTAKTSVEGGGQKNKIFLRVIVPINLWIGGSPIYLSDLGSGFGFEQPCRGLGLGRVTFPMT